MRSFFAYKGFESDLTCRGFQYEVGKTYTMEGEPKLCEQGFHCCLKLSDVFMFYSPIGYEHSVVNFRHIAKCMSSGNRYCQVEVLGDIDNSSFEGMCVSTKIVTNKIKIVKELTTHDIITILAGELVHAKGWCQTVEATLAELEDLNHIESKRIGHELFCV